MTHDFPSPPKANMTRTHLYPALLLATLAATGITPTCAATNNGQLSRDTRLQIEFRLPAHWEKRACRYAEEGMQCLELRPHKQRTNPDPAITIYVKDASLDEALSSHILFEKREGRWIKNGRVGESAASPIAGKRWIGIEAAASCGISDPETGFHAGAGTCYTAILSNGPRSAIIETDGFESTLEFAERIKNSFRFLE